MKREYKINTIIADTLLPKSVNLISPPPILLIINRLAYLY